MPAWLTQRAGDAFRQNTAGATELGQDARSTIGAFVPFLQTIQDQQQNLKTEGMKLNLASASLGHFSCVARLGLSVNCAYKILTGLMGFWKRRMPVT